MAPEASRRPVTVPDSAPELSAHGAVYVVPPALFQRLGSPTGSSFIPTSQLNADSRTRLRQDQRSLYVVHPDAELTRSLNRSGLEWYALTPELSDISSPAEIAQGLESAAETAVNRHLSSESQYLRGDFTHLIDRRAEQENGFLYSATFPELDRALGGGFYPGLHLLGGGTSGGKTAMALHIALLNAEAGKPVLYITFEQSKAELWSRIIAPLIQVPLSAFRTGQFKNQALRPLLEGHPAFDHLHTSTAYQLQIHEGNGARSSQQWGIDRIIAEVRRQHSLSGQSPLVILDYLQRMPSDIDAEKRHKIDDIVMSLQVRLGREEQTPILLLSSVSRGHYGELLTRSLDDRLAVWKESGGIEYTANTALLLYPLNPEHALALGHELPSETATLEYRWRYLVLDLVKNREGEAGMQYLVKWHPGSGRYALIEQIDVGRVSMKQ